MCMIGHLKHVNEIYFNYYLTINTKMPLTFHFSLQFTTVRPGTRIHFLVQYNNQDWYYSLYPDQVGIQQFVNDRSTPTRLVSFNIVLNA